MNKMIIDTNKILDAMNRRRSELEVAGNYTRSSEIKEWIMAIKDGQFNFDVMAKESKK